MMINEGLQFGIALAGVFALTGYYEYTKSKQRTNMRKDKFADGATCFIFLLTIAVMYIHKPFGDGDEPSIMITAGAAMQLFAFLLLWLAPMDVKDGQRAPAEFGMLMVFALVCRLWCTMKYDGYLPSDETGDGCIQTLEAVAMEVALIGVARAGVSLEEFKRFGSGLLGAGVFAMLCYGSLDYRPHVDRLYAATQYAELIAWFFMADFARKASRANGRVNAIYVLPSFLQALCRCYFWVSAYVEIAPQNPIRLQVFFPTVLVGLHIVMALVILRIGVLQDLRVVEVERETPV